MNGFGRLGPKHRSCEVFALVVGFRSYSQSIMYVADRADKMQNEFTMRVFMAAIAVASPDEHLRISLNFAGTSTPEMWMFQ